MADASTWEIIGTSADVVTGLGTMAAFIVAARSLRQQATQNCQAQASAVAVSDIIRTDGAADPDEINLTLYNHSSLPVYFVTGVVYHTKRKDWFEYDFTTYPEVAPGETLRFKPYDTRSGPYSGGHSFGVRFSDAAGNAWLRTADGFLFADPHEDHLAQSKARRLRPRRGRIKRLLYALRSIYWSPRTTRIDRN